MNSIVARYGKRRLPASGLPAAIIEVLEPRALLATVNVAIMNFNFNPDPVTIHAGDTVHWVWDASTHSTTSVAGSAESWDSGVQNAGATFDHTFNTPGTFTYFCKIHGMDNGDGTASGMSSKVVVLPASTPPPGGNTPPPGSGTTPPPPQVSPLTASGVMINGKTGRPFQGTVATFAEANAKAKDFRALINWGDQAAPTAGRIKSLGHGRFGVVGSHRFGQAGMFQATVSISDSAGHQATASSMEMIQTGRRK